jgi:hypothetical protein
MLNCSLLVTLFHFEVIEDVYMESGLRGGVALLYSF